MRRAAWPVGVAAVALLLGGCSEKGDRGCGEDDRPGLSHAGGTPLPVPVSPHSRPLELDPEKIEAALPPAKVNSSFTEDLMRRLMSDTMTTAGAIGEVRPGECRRTATERGGRTRYRCTMTYEGLDVLYEVLTTDIDASSWTRYRARLVTGVLTAESVRAEFGWTRRGKSWEPRCDRMPKLFSAEAGKDTGYRCQVLGSECSNGAWNLHWDDQAVRVDDDGRVDFGAPDPAPSGASATGLAHGEFRQPRTVGGPRHVAHAVR